jgi:hypothetical protein
VIDSWPGSLAPDVIGVLDRHLSVAIAEISRTGCLLESSSAIPVGTVARLSIEIDGQIYGDDVRVVRCSSLPGAGERHHVGVTFLPLQRPSATSLRLYAASLKKD